MQRDYVYRFFPIVLVDFHSHKMSRGFSMWNDDNNDNE